jgi:uncharacterized membrane protein YeaQ/YmgE (transglycosylase-associated protein family)
MQATKPTFSFGVLLLITLGLVGAVYYFSRQIKDQNLLQLPMAPQNKDLANEDDNQAVKSTDPSQPVSTNEWPYFQDGDHDVSFKYPMGWQVKSYKRTDFDIVVLTPDQGQDNIRIYVSPNEYVGMAGLQTSPIKVGGIAGISANNMVVGVKQGKYFFTFDAGDDQQLLPEFNGILTTVVFKGTRGEVSF